MIEGAGYLAYAEGDLMLLHVTGNLITFTLVRNEGDGQSPFRFLSNPNQVHWKRNMGIVQEPRAIRALELLISRHDGPLFFADEIEALDAEPSSETQCVSSFGDVFHLGRLKP